jgi:ribosome-associated heat shock protein Hsp15
MARPENGDLEDRDWQRLDKWLWCARVMKARSDCAALVALGSIRINRQPTEKAHARLRVGDVLTIPVRGAVRVVAVLSLAHRRGPASEARTLYRDLTEEHDSSRSESPAPASACVPGESSAYRRL